MRVYIPKHLRNIKIVDQMCNLIQVYSEVTKLDRDSFDDYQYFMKTDPVRIFLKIIIKEDSTGQYVLGTEQNYQAVIDYLAELFYSVKGTTKVLDYMHTFLGFGSGDNWYDYTPQLLQLTINSSDLSDTGYFNTALVNFLNALMYFSELVITGSVGLNLEGEIGTYYGGKGITYKEVSVDEEFIEV